MSQDSTAHMPAARWLFLARVSRAICLLISVMACKRPPRRTGANMGCYAVSITVTHLQLDIYPLLLVARVRVAEWQIMFSIQPTKQPKIALTNERVRGPRAFPRTGLTTKTSDSLDLNTLVPPALSSQELCSLKAGLQAADCAMRTRSSDSQLHPFRLVSP